MKDQADHRPVGRANQAEHLLIFLLLLLRLFLLFCERRATRVFLCYDDSNVKKAALDTSVFFAAEYQGSGWNIPKTRDVLLFFSIHDLGVCWRFAFNFAHSLDSTVLRLL
ncbi:hypothetical protein BpHYR1_020541 [Brachionus plicatilis]|uniref:Uncharacterized protein n=1 Tax=Brachionus plicatilis TaxID=10195 RepID=A0A3M7S867_BRAPC|nr:hypothetical protein BpHYR1_020541 [Brachionus plicatilis]